MPIGLADRSYDREIASTLNYKRREVGPMQEALAKKAGVAPTFIRKTEHKKENLFLVKVNHERAKFGHKMSVISCHQENHLQM